MIFFGCWPLVIKRTCIKGGFHDAHTLFYIVVCSVRVKYLIKYLLCIFSLVWTPMSTKLWGFSCSLIRNMFGSLVLCLTHLAPHVHFPCIGHALHIATSCTHICYPCHALVYTLFLHPSMSYLPYVLYHFVFSYIWTSFSHSSCTPYAYLSLFTHSSLALISPWPFVYSCKKGGKYTLE